MATTTTMRPAGPGNSCPRCGGSLAPFRDEGSELQLCGDCHRFWRGGVQADARLVQALWNARYDAWAADADVGEAAARERQWPRGGRPCPSPREARIRHTAALAELRAAEAELRAALAEALPGQPPDLAALEGVGRPYPETP